MAKQSKISPKIGIHKKNVILDKENNSNSRISQNHMATQRAKAVAIKDTSQSGKMPKIIATGAGTFADQILQIAWANNIKVREDADLIEILSAIDIDSEIPVETFAAVAEILTYVYRANANKKLNENIENEMGKK
ncbi:MAG: EscU/YscU/HrcU family type III secretion system export apparatus switch protein [Rhodospirillales bacterium]